MKQPESDPAAAQAASSQPASSLRDRIQAATVKAAHRVVESGDYRLYSGQHCEQLSEQICQLCGSAESLLTSSGTAAVELALRSAGVGSGDRVLISAYDYPGNFWAIERVGARPVLLDTEQAGWRIDCTRLPELGGGPFRAMIASHLHGQLQPLSELRLWCEAAGAVLLEDACQAVGARVDGKPAGSVGHVGVISFGGGKVLSAGRGGALVTSDAGIAQRARIAAGSGSGPYSLSELQAAVVVAQLPWLTEINQLCRGFFAELAACLYGHLPAHLSDTSRTNLSAAASGCVLADASAGPQIETPYLAQSAHAAFYQAGLLINRLQALVEPPPNPVERLAERLRNAGVPVGAGFAGFHRRSQRRCDVAQTLIHAPRIAATTLTIHHSAAWKLTPADLAASLMQLN